MRMKPRLLLLCATTTFSAVAQTVPTKAPPVITTPAVDPTLLPLKLTDGRVFTAWQILSETPTTVFLKFKGGAASVRKTLLPPDVLALHPINEAAANAEAARLAATARARNQQPAEPQMRKFTRAEFDAEMRRGSRSAQSPTPQEGPVSAAATSLQPEVELLIRQKVSDYYAKYPKGTGGYPYLRSVAMVETKPITGWSNRTRTEGTAQIQVSNGVETRNFEAIVEVTNGTPRVVDLTLK
jgi:hypothetical protein